jgi:hypothetical protein
MAPSPLNGGGHYGPRPNTIKNLKANQKEGGLTWGPGLQFKWSERLPPIKFKPYQSATFLSNPYQKQLEKCQCRTG